MISLNEGQVIELSSKLDMFTRLEFWDSGGMHHIIFVSKAYFFQPLNVVKFNKHVSLL